MTDEQNEHETCTECGRRIHQLVEQTRFERNQALDRAEKMHLLGLKLARELADLERENASLRRRLREGGR